MKTTKPAIPSAVRKLELQPVAELAVHELITVLLFRCKKTNGMEFADTTETLRLIAVMSQQLANQMK